MLKSNNKKSLKEHLERIKYISKHRLGEASYHPVFEMDGDDDLDMKMYNAPQPVTKNDSNIFEAGEEDEITANQLDNSGEANPPDTGTGFPDEQPADTMAGGAAPAPADPMADPMGGDMEADPMAAPADPMADPMGGMGAPDMNADKEREDIQNQLIKLQLSALEQMNDKMKMMDMTMADLKGVMGQLSKDVEEVREPTNVEKVAARKYDSHPYYYRLNDLWQGNSFQARMDDGKTGEYGMKQLEDGTYVADFDSFPKLSDMELKKSFQ
jgi:hypothetical protein